MQGCYRRIRSLIAGLIIAGICLLSFPAQAQQVGPPTNPGAVSDDDFVRLSQQIKELKNATFRAFLRMRLLSWGSQPGPVRRRAALELAIQGVTDLCEHQDEIWTPTASNLHGGFVKRIQTLQAPQETPLEICVLKTARSANQQETPEAIFSQLIRLNTTRSPERAEKLNAVLSLEEKQPGTLALRMMPFFASVFLEKSVPPEIQTRFVAIAVRASRLTNEAQAS